MKLRAHAATAASDSATTMAGPVPGKQTLVGPDGGGAAATRAAARRALTTGTVPLPYASSIQRAFGKHDISGVRAHIDAAATAAMGAKGFAAGDHVVLAPGADLFVVAHEVAHVVQQRGGVSVPDGVGEANDTHEQHANEVAARVVAGQSAEGLLDRYGSAGGSAPSAAHAPVQLYREVPVGNQTWRISDGNRMLVGHPAYRSKDLFLDAGLVGTANGALGQAGSSIRLELAGEQKQVKLREDGQNTALESDILTRAYHKGGGRRDLSQEEMQRHYFEAQNELLERNPPRDGDGSVEERRMAARNDDRSITLERVRPAIRPNGLGDNGSVKANLGRMRPHPGDNRIAPRGLRLPSDCHETARVIMGVTDKVNLEHAMTTGRVVPHGKDQMDLEKPMGASGSSAPTHVEQTGLTALHDKLLAFVPVLNQDPQRAQQPDAQWYLNLIPHATHAECWEALHTMRELHPALYHEFTQWAGIDSSAEPEIGEALVTYRIGGRISDTIAKAPKMWDVLDQIVQTLLPHHSQQLDVQTTANRLAPGRDAVLYVDLLDIANEVKGLLVRLSHQIGENEQLRTQWQQADDTNLWDKHWGGVIAKDGADYATLENDASTEHEHGALNEVWGFGLYGSAKPNQSFHDEMMRTGDFGNFASTLRYKR